MMSISVPRMAAAARGVLIVRPLDGFLVRNQPSPSSRLSVVDGAGRRLDLLDREHRAGIELDLRLVDEQDGAAAGAQRANTIADEQRLEEARRTPLVLSARCVAIHLALNQDNFALRIGRRGRLRLRGNRRDESGREETEDYSSVDDNAAMGHHREAPECRRL